MQIGPLITAISQLIAFIADQLGESTADVRKRVIAELRKADEDETDVISGEIDSNLPASDR